MHGPTDDDHDHDQDDDDDKHVTSGGNRLRGKPVCARKSLGGPGRSRSLTTKRAPAGVVVVVPGARATDQLFARSPRDTRVKPPPSRPSSSRARIRLPPVRVCRPPARARSTVSRENPSVPENPRYFYIFFSVFVLSPRNAAAVAAPVRVRRSVYAAARDDGSICT